VVCVCVWCVVCVVHVCEMCVCETLHPQAARGVNGAAAGETCTIARGWVEPSVLSNVISTSSHRADLICATRRWDGGLPWGLLGAGCVWVQ
jgi:hypothetical protein